MKTTAVSLSTNTRSFIQDVKCTQYKFNILRIHACEEMKQEKIPRGTRDYSTLTGKADKNCLRVAVVQDQQTHTVYSKVNNQSIYE